LEISSNPSSRLHSTLKRFSCGLEEKGKKNGTDERGIYDDKRMGSNNACFNDIPHSLTYIKKYRKFALPQNH